MKLAVIIPASSEALFDRNSNKVFGGANVQMYQIAKEMGQCEDIDCYALIEDYATIDFDDQSRFNLIKTFKNNDSFPVKIWKYHKQLRKIKPDVILQRGLTLSSSLLAIYCKISKIRFVFMFAHDNEAEGRYQESGQKGPLFRWLLDHASVLITQNSYQKNELLKRYDKKTEILRSGFYLKPNRELGGTYVLWVARHSEWKHPELYIQLAKENPDIQFKMVCPAHRASGYNKLVEAAARVGNLEFIRFVGIDEIDKYYAEAKLFVNTSDYEGFPQTFIQAAMNGVPILSLRVNPDQILTEHKFGFCCNGSMDQLQEKLVLLSSNTELYQAMSKNAFNYAQLNHDIKNNVRKIISLISDS